MVAEHGKDAQPRPEPSERLGRRADIVGRKGNVVARQRYDIRPQAVRKLDGALDLSERRIKAVVDVREVDDPQSVVGGSQPLQPDVSYGDLGVAGEKPRRLSRFPAIQREGHEAAAPHPSSRA